MPSINALDLVVSARVEGLDELHTAKKLIDSIVSGRGAVSAITGDIGKAVNVMGKLEEISNALEGVMSLAGLRGVTEQNKAKITQLKKAIEERGGLSNILASYIGKMNLSKFGAESEEEALKKIEAGFDLVYKIVQKTGHLSTPQFEALQQIENVILGRPKKGLETAMLNLLGERGLGVFDEARIQSILEKLFTGILGKENVQQKYRVLTPVKSLELELEKQLQEAAREKKLESLFGEFSAAVKSGKMITGEKMKEFERLTGILKGFRVSDYFQEVRIIDLVIKSKGEKDKELIDEIIKIFGQGDIEKQLQKVKFWTEKVGLSPFELKTFSNVSLAQAKDELELFFQKIAEDPEVKQLLAQKMPLEQAVLQVAKNYGLDVSDIKDLLPVFQLSRFEIDKYMQHLIETFKEVQGELQKVKEEGEKLTQATLAQQIQAALLNIENLSKFTQSQPGLEGQKQILDQLTKIISTLNELSNKLTQSNPGDEKDG